MIRELDAIGHFALTDVVGEDVMTNSHKLENFIDETVKLNAKWLLAEVNELPNPIEALYLWTDQGRLEVIGALVVGVGKQKAIVHGDVPQTTLPLNDEEDKLLEEFHSTYGYEEIEWGDYFELPESLYRMEMIAAASRVAESLRAEGLAFSNDAKVGILIEDERYHGVDSFRDSVKESLAGMEPSAAKAFLAIYYSDPENKADLLQG